jgi:hypothetical protein
MRLVCRTSLALFGEERGFVLPVHVDMRLVGSWWVEVWEKIALSL